ncbi:hypothetical protein D9M72_552900 [compost metagenome]
MHIEPKVSIYRRTYDYGQQEINKNIHPIDKTVQSCRRIGISIRASGRGHTIKNTKTRSCKKERHSKKQYYEYIKRRVSEPSF